MILPLIFRDARNPKRIVPYHKRIGFDGPNSLPDLLLENLRRIGWLMVNLNTEYFPPVKLSLKEKFFPEQRRDSYVGIHDESFLFKSFKWGVEPAYAKIKEIKSNSVTWDLIHNVFQVFPFKNFSMTTFYLYKRRESLEANEIFESDIEWFVGESTYPLDIEEELIAAYIYIDPPGSNLLLRENPKKGKYYKHASQGLFSIIVESKLLGTIEDNKAFMEEKGFNLEPLLQTVPMREISYTFEGAEVTIGFAPQLGSRKYEVEPVLVFSYGTITESEFSKIVFLDEDPRPFKFTLWHALLWYNLDNRVNPVEKFLEISVPEKRLSSLNTDILYYLLNNRKLPKKTRTEGMLCTSSEGVF